MKVVVFIAKRKFYPPAVTRVLSRVFRRQDAFAEALYHTSVVTPGE